MTPSRLAWIGASVRLPLRVVSVLVIAPGRLLWLAAASGRRRSLGIEPPRMYSLGFEHANCGGCCVKGGQGQWARALAVFPELYRWHENQEEQTRKHIGSDVSVLRDRTNGETKPLTLREFREHVEAGKPPQDDLFSCTCMED